MLPPLQLAVSRLFFLFAGTVILGGSVFHRALESIEVFDPIALRIVIGVTSLIFLGFTFHPGYKRFTPVFFRILLVASTLHGFILSASNQLAISYLLAIIVILILVIMAADSEAYLFFYAFIVVIGASLSAVLAREPIVNPFVFFSSLFILMAGASLIALSQIRLRRAIEKATHEP